MTEILAWAFAQMLTFGGPDILGRVINGLWVVAFLSVLICIAAVALE